MQGLEDILEKDNFYCERKLTVWSLSVGLQNEGTSAASLEVVQVHTVSVSVASLSLWIHEKTRALIGTASRFPRPPTTAICVTLNGSNYISVRLVVHSVDKATQC